MHVAGHITPAFVRQHYNIYNNLHYSGSSNSGGTKRDNRPSLYNSRSRPTPTTSSLRLGTSGSGNSGNGSSSGSVGAGVGVVSVDDGLSNVLFLLQFACLDLRSNSTTYDKVRNGLMWDNSRPSYPTTVII